MLQWLREQGSPWDGKGCALAAADGHLEVLQWAAGAEGCPNWSTDVHKNAAASGHLTILKWAAEAERDWPHGAVWAAAARAEQVEVLQWLIQEGYPWSVGAVRVMARSTNPEVQQFTLARESAFTRPEGWVLFPGRRGDESS